MIEYHNSTINIYLFHVFTCNFCQFSPPLYLSPAGSQLLVAWPSPCVSSALDLCSHCQRLPQRAIQKLQCLEIEAAPCPVYSLQKIPLRPSFPGIMLFSYWFVGEVHGRSWFPFLMTAVAHSAGKKSGSERGSLPRTHCLHSPLSSAECLLDE